MALQLYFSCDRICINSGKNTAGSGEFYTKGEEDLENSLQEEGIFELNLKTIFYSHLGLLAITK